MTDAATDSLSGQRQRVWDLPVRITHWLIVVFISLSWWTAEFDRMQWHAWSGYALLTLVLFRVYWGFVGSSTARFRHFLRGPGAVLRYSQGLFSRPGEPVVGHNPLGGWSSLLLLILILGQVLLGLFSEDVDGLASGPLSYMVSYDAGRWAAETHEEFFDVLLLFIGLHIAAVAFYLVYKRNNLVAAMFTGRAARDTDTEESLYFAPLWRAAIGFVLAGAFVWWLVTQVGFTF
ncbi:Ni/Fe-hydrogenase 1 b-type cytochrome subunit [Proteobacteria bacterium 005FR1]|nr:Ni/Fe-hydrogenase 1 b-type cytochrome subunit [Proteobacteria bacterium 005FR1]